MKDSPYPNLRLLSLALAFLLPALPASDKGGPPTVPATWVELGESGAIIARQAIPLGATGQAQTCPAIQIAGVGNPPTTLSPRTPAPAGFPILLCEVVIPAGATSATINGISLPLPKSQIGNIVVIGDTGCKGDVTGTGKKIEALEEPEDDDDAEEAAAAKGSKKPNQDCTPTGWPFKAVSKSAAASAPADQSLSRQLDSALAGQRRRRKVRCHGQLRGHVRPVARRPVRHRILQTIRLRQPGRDLDTAVRPGQRPGVCGQCHAAESSASVWREAGHDFSDASHGLLLRL